MASDPPVFCARWQLRLMHRKPFASSLFARADARAKAWGQALPAHAGYRTIYFTTAADLAARCHRAAIKGRWATTMRFLTLDQRLLVIDELGYLPLPAEAASALFQVVSQRYLKTLDRDHDESGRRVVRARSSAITLSPQHYWTDSLHSGRW